MTVLRTDRKHASNCMTEENGVEKVKKRKNFFRSLCCRILIILIILGIVPPGMFQNPIYTIVATVTSCIVFAIMYWKQELLEGENRMVYDKIMLVMDSVGLGVFTVMGVDKGITEGYMGRTFFLVFLGTVTGVGGGLIRDMMAGVPPYIFVRHIYACASIVGAIACVWVYRLWGGGPAMVIGTVVVILVRYLAAHYRWNLPRLRRE